MKRFLLTLAVSILVFAFVAPAGFGDTIYLKNGRKFEGKLVEETAGAYRFKIKGLGEQTFKKSDVLKIEKGETIFDQYETKRKALKKNDAQGHYDLGMWCRENGLKKQAVKAFKSAVAADENHAGAQQELGFVKYEGKWMPRKEMEVILERIAAEEAALIGGFKLITDYVDEEARFAIGTPKGFEPDEMDGLSIRFTGPELRGAPIEILLERTEPSGGLDALIKEVKDELEVIHEDLKVTAEPKPANLAGTSGKLLSFAYAEKGLNLEHRVIVAVFPEFDLRLSFICTKGAYEQLSPFFTRVSSSVKVLAKAADGSSADFGFEFALPDENYKVLDSFPIQFKGLDWKPPPGTESVQAVSGGYMIMLLIFPGKKSDTTVDSSSLAALRDSMSSIFPEQARKQMPIKAQGESKSVKVAGEDALTGSLNTMGGIGRYAVFMHGENHFRVLFMNVQNGMGQIYVTQDFEKFLASFRFKK